MLVLMISLCVILTSCFRVVDNDFSEDNIPALPEECLIIKDGVLTGIENKPQEKYRVTLPDGVKEIGNNAFEGDDLLVEITFNIGLRDIGVYAFSNCVNLKEVDMSNASSLRGIGGCAFSGCASLENVIFPSEIPYMGKCAFEACVSLTELEFSNKISTTFEGGLFLNCTGLRTVRFSEKQREVEPGMFEGCASLENVYLPETVEIIYNDAFKNCVSLESIELPDKLRIIAGDAFYGCSSLKSLDIPESATNVYDAFDGCEALIETENGISYVDGWAVNIAEETENVVFREGTVGIAHGMKCSNVKTVYIPSSVKWVSDTFRESTTLTELIFADNSCLKELPSYAFSNCTSLERIEFGKNSSLSSFAWKCFAGCTSLKSITIPASVEGLPNSFSGCTSLERIEFEKGSRLEIIGDGALENTPSLKEFAVPEGVVTIGDKCFLNCVSLEKVTVSSTVTEIGFGVFDGCEKLREVEMADTEGWRSCNLADNETYRELQSSIFSDSEAAAKWFKTYSEAKRNMLKKGN